MLKEKRLLECTNIILISYQNNIKIFSIDSKQVKMIKIYCIICGKYRKFKNPRILYILLKKLGLSIVRSKCGNEYQKIFKEESIKILKILDLVINIDEYQKIYNHGWRKHKSRI